jgi:hypothetical protein
MSEQAPFEPTKHQSNQMTDMELRVIAVNVELQQSYHKWDVVGPDNSIVGTKSQETNCRDCHRR